MSDKAENTNEAKNVGQETGKTKENPVHEKSGKLRI